MNDFQPDYFSPSPEDEHDYNFVEASKIIKDICSNYKILETVGQIGAISGLGVNSKNIRLDCEQNSYLLKFWNTHDLNRINEICKILIHVNHDGITAPYPIQNNESCVTTVIDNQVVTLFTYIQGSIFVPKIHDLENYFSDVSYLFLSLKNIGLYKEELSNLVDVDSLCFTLLNLCDNKDSYFFYNFPESMEILLSIKNHLLKSLDLYSKNIIPNFNQFSHFDLHPRNILQLSNNRYAFLDFESCDMYDPSLAWGYTLIKILRQVLVGSVDTKLPSKMGSDAMNLIKNLPFAENLQVELLPTFGRVEIMRRLTYIANAYNTFNSSEWISMFPVQIQLLKESLIIFDQ